MTGKPNELIARVLTRGVSLIEEYLQLIGDNLKEVKGIREYLHCRGVKLQLGSESKKEKFRFESMESLIRRNSEKTLKYHITVDSAPPGPFIRS